MEEAHMSTCPFVIDDEFRSLIPPPDPGDLELLESNIISDGCRDPLAVWDGILIDGHNRYEICQRNGIEFQTVDISLDDRDAAKLWIIDNQFGRRNLSDIDRISLATKREAIVKPLADAKMKSGKGSDGSGGRGKKKNPSAKLRQGLKTSKELAKTAGVGERTYDAGKLILDAAAKGEISEEEVNAIRRKEKSIHRVAKDIKEKRQKDKRQTQRKESAAQVEQDVFDNVHIGDFREHADKVADGSLSLIFTDPPYDRKSAELLEGLADFAAAKLCDGGSLICYVGQTQLPSAISCLSSRLRYWWTLCCLHSGGANLMNEYGIRCGWKAVLWFVKNTRDNKEDIVHDVMSGGREKEHHDWQQSQAEAEYWIEHLCPPDGIVCDPFLGGGTTGAAAIKLQRKWIGFEIDKDQALIAMKRMA